MEFRNRIVTDYDEIFGGGKGVGLDAVSNFGTKWGWYSSLYALAQGDIRRFEHITQLEMHKCFMMLSFLQEKSEIENKKIKKNFK